MISALDLIRFKSISHSTAEEALQLIGALEAPRPKPGISGSPNKSLTQLPQPAPAATHLLSQAPPGLSESSQQPFKKVEIVRKSQNLDDSMVNNFLRKIDEAALKEEYAVLWYEKLALESSVDRLKEQLRKKDELIHQITAEINQGRARRGY